MGFFDDLLNFQKNIMDKRTPNVSVKCEHCGATATGKVTDKTIRCEYCGSYAVNTKYESPTEVFGNSTQGGVVDNHFSHHDDFHREPRRHHRGHIGGAVAWIEKGGLFYEGEIPGITFSKVSLCHSYEECVAKLKEKYRSEKSRAFFDRPVQDIEKIRREHPRAEIIRLD